MNKFEWVAVLFFGVIGSFAAITYETPPEDPEMAKWVLPILALLYGFIRLAWASRKSVPTPQPVKAEPAIATSPQFMRCRCNHCGSTDIEIERAVR